MQRGTGFKFSLVLLGSAFVYLNAGQAIEASILFNHPAVYDGSKLIRAGSIEKLDADGTRSTLVSGLDNPSGIALDTEGNLYYGNVGRTILYHISSIYYTSMGFELFKRRPDGTVTSLGQVRDTPGSISIGGWGFDIAVGSSGEIYFNHPSVYNDSKLIRAGSIEKLDPDGTRHTLISGLDNPSGIAFDTEGNLYYGNVTSGSLSVSLFKRSPDGTMTSLGQVFDTSAGSVSISGWGFDIAVGSSGEIYFNHPSVYGDSKLIRSGSIEKLDPDGTRSTLVSGLDNPSGIAIDSEGNLYYGNVGRTGIYYTSSIYTGMGIELFKLQSDGTVMNLGQVRDTPGSISIGGWGFDVAIPEPAAFMLLGWGGLTLLRRRRTD